VAPSRDLLMTNVRSALFVSTDCCCMDVLACTLQRDIREEHVNNFLAPLYMSDIMPNPEEKRLACATHLHKRFNFTGGVSEARTKLDTIFLAPKVRKKDEEQQYRPEKLYKVLRQAWPRFQRDLEHVMVPAFMVKAGEWLNIGSRGRVNGRNNMPIFSRDEARKTIRAYWMFTTAMGRNSVLAGLHAGFQRLQGIGVVMVEATATTDRHYKVSFKTYAALLAMVSLLLFTLSLTSLGVGACRSECCVSSASSLSLGIEPDISTPSCGSARGLTWAVIGPSFPFSGHRCTSRCTRWPSTRASPSGVAMSTRRSERFGRPSCFYLTTS